MLSKITWVVCAISSFRGEMMPRKTGTSISSQYGEHSVKRSRKNLHFVTEICGGFNLSMCNEQMGIATSEVKVEL